MSVVSVLLFFPPFLSFIYAPTCQTDSLICIPKFSVHTTVLNPIHESQFVSLMKTMYSLLLVKDFDDAKIGDVKLSLENKVFKLNYLGYCKLDEVTKLEACYTFHNGLDLLSVILKDIGLEMAQSIIGDPDVVSNELVDVYHQFLETSFGTYSYAFRAYLCSLLGKYLPYIMMVHFFSSTMALLLCFFLLCFLRDVDKHTPTIVRIVGAIVFFASVSIVCSGCDFAVESFYIKTLHNLLEEFNMASIYFDPGFIIHCYILACQVCSLFCLALLMISKPWIGKSHK
ncbi:unnamed protein product [Ambrosiozyma monospora]|uniref:Unnamed protein product n=1 Tax=Ambrosiozyma monospora TaxID=43982 RepID=A0A9W6WKW3_AMBMO|nr:unnamed protein product [Ambrosiozyma monospora]